MLLCFGYLGDIHTDFTVGHGERLEGLSALCHLFQQNLILEIEVEGASNVKRIYPDAVLVMLLPPSFKEQEARLRGRGTETEEVILARLEQAKKEVLRLPEYDYVICNEDGKIDECADTLLSIVRAEQCAVRRHPDAVRTYFGD